MFHAHSGVLAILKAGSSSSEPSLSDHRHILSTLECFLPVRVIENPMGTNWDFFREGLKSRVERDPEMHMKDEAGLGLAVLFVQQALTSACEDNCPFKPAKTGRRSLKWTFELVTLGRGVGRYFNKCLTDKNP